MAAAAKGLAAPRKKRKLSAEKQAAAEKAAARKAELEASVTDSRVYAKCEGDALSALPYEVLFQVLSYLDPISLVRVQMMSTLYRDMMKHDIALFEKLCREYTAFRGDKLPAYMSYADLLRLTISDRCQHCQTPKVPTKVYVLFNMVSCRPCFDSRTINIQTALPIVENLTGLDPTHATSLLKILSTCSDKAFRSTFDAQSHFMRTDVDAVCGAYIDSGCSLAAFEAAEKRVKEKKMRMVQAIEIITYNRRILAQVKREHEAASSFMFYIRVWKIFLACKFDDKYAAAVPKVTNIFGKDKKFLDASTLKDDPAQYGPKLLKALQKLTDEELERTRRQEANAFLNEITTTAQSIFRKWYNAQSREGQEKVERHSVLGRQRVSVSIVPYLHHISDAFNASPHKEFFTLTQVLKTADLCSYYTNYTHKSMPDVQLNAFQIRRKTGACATGFSSMRSLIELKDHLHNFHAAGTQLSVVALLDPGADVVTELPDDAPEVEEAGFDVFPSRDRVY